MEVYGMRTGKTDKNGSKLYEYDRVYVEVNGKKVSATIINTDDRYHPDFKILVDKCYWKDDKNPELVNFDNDVCVLIKKGELGYHYGKNVFEFKNYCWRYDYHHAC